MNDHRKKILVGGVFDILHVGHLDFFERSKELGDELVVVVANDETVKRRKGRFPVNTEEDRFKIIKSLEIVDKAVIGYPNNFLKTVKKINPNIIILGPDQEFNIKELKKTLNKKDLNCEIKRLKGLHKKERAKSSEIAKRILKNYEIDDFKHDKPKINSKKAEEGEEIDETSNEE